MNHDPTTAENYGRTPVEKYLLDSIRNVVKQRDTLEKENKLLKKEVKDLNIKQKYETLKDTIETFLSNSGLYIYAKFAKKLLIVVQK